MSKLIKDIVVTVLQNHPKECVFEEDAENKIYEYAMRTVTPSSTQSEIVDAVAAAVVRYEIYCPSEGVDKRNH